MSTPIIQVEHLSKKYDLFNNSRPSGSLRHTIENIIRHPLDIIRPKQATASESEFWALDDVSFELNKGEVLGVIGRNGAGKSTLLKILSRITEPTKGSIHLRGRVSSLLEVGTGFHPELTGRENIFLNGAILGMSKVEIKRKFDEIVAFAEIEKFIDTPVKRYSSGMYVRLAFAVAAHLEPEILIVDEVLAVGDASFQKKCLGKMRDVSTSEGRTIIFVSHNMTAMSSLCTSGIVLNKGKMEHKIAPIADAIKFYLASIESFSNQSLSERKDRTGKGGIIATKIQLLDEQGKNTSSALVGKPLQIKIYYHCKNPSSLKKVTFSFSVALSGTETIQYFGSELTNDPFDLSQEQGHITCNIPKCSLYPGTYTLNIIIRSEGAIEDWVQSASQFQIGESDFYGKGKLPPSSHSSALMEQSWNLN